ncbi:MAG: acetolactate synthase large subunit [Rhodospirillaceae bacterium TMED8]|nr:acetolactate synthase large subunit [Magnetovibrio sp.]OUT51536.1 MAG: acetolactate synthase large subunit [Rhodospirillaceae bacterium TMED8]
MNGAESLVRTLHLNDIEICFTNPGTSEMHFMAALDRTNALRCILGLHENVVTGAADGFARMAEKPAATLLHLGPGLGNGLANLHNAKKARTSMVNIVGDHATYHLQYGAPLTADIEAIAQTMSHWVKTSCQSSDVALDGAEAVRRARTYPGHIATLILPADAAWGEGTEAIKATAPVEPASPSIDDVEVAARQLSNTGDRGALYLSGKVLTERGLILAGKIAVKTGAKLFAPNSNARIDRGAGRVPVERIPYVVDQGLDRLSQLNLVVSIGDAEPVAFFAYPNKPSRILPDKCSVQHICKENQNGLEALEMLCSALDARNEMPNFIDRRIDNGLPTGTLDQEKIAAIVSAIMPDNAIVVDESITSGRQLNWQTAGARPHSWLSICGGAIGDGPPLAVGAAVACKDRKVLALQADGSAMYTFQALWTQAREGLDVTTVIYANRAYAILKGEMKAVGVEKPGKVADDMFNLTRPSLDFVALARGMGVDGERVDDATHFAAALQRGFALSGPYLIEAVL